MGMENTPLIYIETTIPEGMTAAQFRISRPRVARGWRRLVASVH